MLRSNIQSDNCHFDDKITLRKEGTKNLDALKVLDLFGGENQLWSKFKLDRYYGIEKVKGKGSNLWADNLRIIPSLDLSGFNVIDCDAYGSPYMQIAALYRNGTMAPGTIVFYTDISNTMSATNNELLSNYGLEKINKLAPLMLGRYSHALFLSELNGYGIKEVMEYSVSDAAKWKYYGFFKVAG